MPLDKHMILGVHVTDRINHVGQVQSVLTEFGCNIKTRIGLHDAGDGFCSPNGVLLLEVVGDEDKFNQLSDKLGAVEGIETQKMVFDHP